MLFNATYNKVNHLTPSVKNQTKWFMKFGTSNCVNYSICNPKHSAKYVYYTWTSASSLALAGTSCETEQRRVRNLSSTPWISSLFQNYHIKERATPRAPLREEARGSRVLHRDFSQEEMEEEVLFGYPRRVHSRREVPQEHVWHRSHWRNVSWDGQTWRAKTTRTTSLQKKFACTETIGGFVRTQLVPLRCQFGIDLTLSKQCQPCDSSKIKRMQLISKDGEAIPHLGGIGKNLGGILDEHHHEYVSSTDWSRETW